jgi:methylmalonyl-CoA carboxyltransferase small subunit
LKLKITIEGKTYEAEVEVIDEDERSTPASYAPYQSPSALSSPNSFSPAYGPVGNSGNKKQYLSPVTGIVIAVKVKPGEQVQAGDLMIVLEAMKMETSITAHSAGKVKGVSVAAGDSVKMNQVLMEFK